MAISPHFVDVWVFNQEVDSETIKCQETEVDKKQKWHKGEEILELGLTRTNIVPECGLIY